MRPDPFFLVGCVRSGTTMLRDLLRRHPNLACPEETHFYRWGDPMGTDNLRKVLSSNPVLREHRKIDQIQESEFTRMMEQSTSRADLYQRYMQCYIERNKPQARRWFDKTPQNVYGAMLMACSMPDARFVHIVRNPLNVVASLRLGKVIKVGALLGAINYWTEAEHIMRGLKQAFPDRVYEMRYEDLMDDGPGHTRLLMSFLGEAYDPAWFADFVMTPSDHRGAEVLSPEDTQVVLQACEAGMRRHGYLPAAGGAVQA
ncbi:sulfotransferase family protein [Ideonella azotifigens]|nr:sulfotransferase [Ideonella azotifigens]